ncbi:MAG: restriction endonuclease subunit S [Romboutsia sp.]
MKSNYKRIGDYIRVVDKRNSDLSVENLLGLSITKEFVPSVANTVGTDMSKYKVIKRNQFVCSTMQVRRDKKMPVALLQHIDNGIISPAYYVFEVIDESILLPEYLMMWFSRTEFDREACFYAVGGVRGSLEWEDFCDMKLPIPSIENQREIVNEYNIILDKIILNENIIDKLEDSVQSIYKQWFIDFEFPDEENKPYKSNGGELQYNSQIDKDIPIDFNVGNLENLVSIIDGDRGKNYPSKEEMYDEGFCLFLNAGNVTNKGFKFTDRSFISEEKDNLLRKGKLHRNDVVVTSRGTVGNVGYYSDIVPFENIRINSGMVILRAEKHKEYGIFAYMLLRSKYMKNTIESYLSGSAQPQLPIKDLVKIPIIIPSHQTIIQFAKISTIYQNHIDLKKVENENLLILKDLLLKKMSK